ncbi:MAG: sensor histidine kinase [Candidatus Onthomonas sp.]
MLRKLRIQFVAVIMVIVTVMLCGIFGILYFFTAENMQSESVALMQSIASEPFQPSRPGDSSVSLRFPCFVLQLGTRGEVIATGNGYYDLSDEVFLKELMDSAFASQEQTGIIEEYNLRFCRVATPLGQRLVFSDITTEKSMLQNLAKNCLIIGCLCFLAFLGISILLANWMVKPVEKAWNQQRQFVADASHELKTPLTVIMSNAELLQSPDYDVESKGQFSGSILTMSRQMRVLLERLLDLARADSGQNKASYRTLDLSSLAEKTLLPFEPLFFEQGLSLSSQIQPGITVYGSDQQLAQVLDILLDNAQKYADPSGVVILRLERTGKRHCRLSVSNPGQPLSSAELKNIFKRFYRADKARSRGGGFGLGLSIAESIVTEHHGRIWAESRDGINTFFVELPMK